MARVILGNLDLSDNQLLNALLQVLGSDPTGIEGKLIYHSGVKAPKWFDGTEWKTVGPEGAGGPPSGAAGGDLDGTYPSPTIHADYDTLLVHLAGVESITGVKTFSVSPLVPSPTTDSQAANKLYVDITAQGLNWKDAVRVIGITDEALSTLTTIDDISLADGDRVLLIGQADPIENGLWLASTGAWTRTADGNANDEIRGGVVVPILEGTVDGETQYLCTSTVSSPWVPDTDGSTWTKFSSAVDLSAGDGLTKTGSTLNVIGGTGITANADDIEVDATWLGGEIDTKIAAKRHSESLGTGASQPITHNLGTRDVQVAIHNESTPWEEIFCDIQHTDINTVTLIASPAMPSGYRVTIIA